MAETPVVKMSPEQELQLRWDVTTNLVSQLPIDDPLVREDVVWISAAMIFAVQSPEFATKFGEYGVKHLEAAIDKIKAL